MCDFHSWLPFHFICCFGRWANRTKSVEPRKKEKRKFNGFSNRDARLYALNRSNFAFVIMVRWLELEFWRWTQSRVCDLIICTWPPCVLSSASTQLWVKFHQFGRSTKQQQLVATFTRADDYYDFHGDHTWAFAVFNNKSTNAANRKKWMREYMALFSCDFFFLLSSQLWSFFLSLSLNILSILGKVFQCLQNNFHSNANLAFLLSI